MRFLHRGSESLGAPPTLTGTRGLIGMVGVTDQGRVRHGGLPPTHGNGTDLLKLPTGPPLAFNLNPHSPSADSEGTEFFDALDEIPWTPEGPRHRLPTVAAASSVPQALWPEMDDVQGSEPTFNTSGGCNRSAFSTPTPGIVIGAPPQEQQDTEHKVRGTLALAFTSLLNRLLNLFFHCLLTVTQGLRKLAEKMLMLLFSPSVGKIGQP